MNTRASLLALSLALVALLLASCAEKAPAPAPAPPPVVQTPPPLAAQDWSRPMFYYATNRNALSVGPNGARYGGSRSREMSFGQLLVSATGGQPDGSDLYRVNISLDRVTRMTHARAFSDIERAAARTPGREVLLFIHGFDNSFEDAAVTASRIGVGIGFTGATLLYSWPSEGSPTSYLADRNNAYWAVSGLKELLTELVDDPWIGRVSVVVHSMGNEAFIRAYGELAGKCASTRGGCANLRKVRAIVLAAPDMDREIFLEQYAAKLTSLDARVVLYASRADMALAASAQMQGGDYVRLGKDVLCIPGLQVTDVSDVKTDVLGHSWISQSRGVLRDLRCALSENCNRASTGLLREMTCPARLRYPLPGVGDPADRSTNGTSYWRLVVPQTGSSTPTSAGFGFKLPSFLSN
ncbi:MAG: alpha/beta hydrolase [Humidesulfovibrio sp.]|nr:alpha/beta hydrolase [Humidesulfovibrio sp.]